MQEPSPKRLSVLSFLRLRRCPLRHSGFNGELSV